MSATTIYNSHVSESLIDNVITRQTPEGVALSLMPAGVLPRMGAWLLDLAIRMAILLALSVVFRVFGATGQGLLLIGYFLIDWFYAVLFEVFYQGQTIGKKQFGIKVCQDDGTPIRWQSSMIRNLLRVADFLPFAFFSAMLSMLFHPASKRLGDIVAGTLVVYVPTLQDTYHIVEHQPIELPIPLQLDEQQAVLAFAERSDELPPERRQELAQILRPITSNTSHQEMTQTLIGYANTIIGRQ